MEAGPLSPEHPSLTGGFAVKPRSAVVVSLAGSLDEGDTGTITGYAAGSADSAALDQLRKAARENRLPSIEDAVTADLRNHTSISVSFDGAFFEDGTFVGPDTTAFFAMVETYVKAKRDLLREINFAVRNKRSLKEIFTYIEEVASSSLPNEKLSQAAIYDICKKMNAQELLQLRTRMNDQSAVEMVLQQYQKPWPKLRRM